MLNERGQSAVILALMFMMLLAFVGLATDTGIMYVAYAQLRRAIDAAALGAASQWRENRTQAEMTDTARQYITLQGLTLAKYAPTDPEVIAGTATAGSDKLKIETCVSLFNSTPQNMTEATSSPYSSEPLLCAYPNRKFVRVSATTLVTFSFMQLFGWKDVQLSANTTTEAAALEIVLVIDTSFSMVYDAAPSSQKAVDNPADDDDGDGCVDEPAGAFGCDANSDGWLGDYILPPNYSAKCTITNAASSGITSKLPANFSISGFGIVSPIHSCRPFEWVRDAAMRFVANYVNFPYDRVAIVVFSTPRPLPDNNWDVGGTTGGTYIVQDLINGSTLTSTVTALQNLEPVAIVPCVAAGGTAATIGARSNCGGTNTGGGLRLANAILNGDSSAPQAKYQSAQARQNALRFIIFLSDGAASATDLDAYKPGGGIDYPACPNAPATDANGDGVLDSAPAQSPPNVPDPSFNARSCQDGDGRTYHGPNPLSPTYTDPLYDADDFARYQGFLIQNGKNTIMYSIGLGNEVVQNTGVGTEAGCRTGQTGDATTFPPASYFGYAGFGYAGCNADSLPNGEQLLRFIADMGDGVANPDPCGRLENTLFPGHGFTYPSPAIGQNCGNYYYASAGDVLEKIFTQIAQRIFTRISQ